MKRCRNREHESVIFIAGSWPLVVVRFSLQWLHKKILKLKSLHHRMSTQTVIFLDNFLHLLRIILSHVCVFVNNVLLLNANIVVREWNLQTKANSRYKANLYFLLSFILLNKLVTSTLIHFGGKKLRIIMCFIKKMYAIKH